MEYDIVISDTCLEEIEGNLYYIGKVLKAEKAANRLREKIIKITQILRKFPQSYAKIDKRDRTGREYRRIVIDKYVIIYTIIEENKTVLIAHMYYGGRNYLSGGIL